jgi:putative sporulation protein YyaC
MPKNFTVNSLNPYSEQGIFQALINCNEKNLQPIFVCIGSDLVLGASLGPLIGTMLRNKNMSSYVYGTLNFPITAKEVEYARTYLKQMHPSSISIAIDAAIGNSEDLGLIKIINQGLKPGLGVNKNLGVVGDISIIGIVAKNSINNKELFSLTRLNLVYKMAEIISDSLSALLWERAKYNKNNVLPSKK